MGSSPRHRRPGTALLAVSLVLGPLLLVSAGCGGGTGTARPSGGASITRTHATDAASPQTPASRSARPDRTETTAPAPSAPAPSRTPERVPTTTAPPAVAVPPPASPVPVQTPAAPVAATTSPANSGLGALGWTLLIALAALLIGGLLMWRSRQTSAWDAEADAVDADTRTVLATRLPPVLTAEAADQRALIWPPVRTDLVALSARWDLLVQGASGEPRRDRALRVRGLLQELVAAVDAENLALADAQDWTLLRPRVDGTLRALSAALVGQPRADARSS